MTLGVRLNSPDLTRWGVVVQSPFGVFVLSILLALFTTFFLTLGLKLYVRVQRLLFVLTIAAITCVTFIFIADAPTFVSQLNSFVETVVDQLQLETPTGLHHEFVSFIVKDVESGGFNTAAPFSWIATLGIIPIAWTSLQWATYSVEQNEEITQSGNFWRQVLITLGSAVAVTVFLMLVAYVEDRGTSNQFVTALSAAYWQQQASPETINFVKSVLQPFPNVLAMASTGSLLLVIIIALGFIANSFQITCNCFIGVTRILVKMGNDGMLPITLPHGRRIDYVDPESHTPKNAHWLYFCLSVL
jgi:amino acid transporter